MSTHEIPFLDLVTVHRELRDELRSVFETALDTAGFIGGPMVREFERDFAEFCEAVVLRRNGERHGRVALRAHRGGCPGRGHRGDRAADLHRLKWSERASSRSERTANPRSEARRGQRCG